MATDATSFGCSDFVDSEPAGRKVIPVVGSVHIASLSTVRPAATSTSPAEAPGENFRERDGLRRSASTRITREPACAIIAAKLAAMVDLPSFGKLEVTPITLFASTTLLRSATTFSDRNNSVNCENGTSTT